MKKFIGSARSLTFQYLTEYIEKQKFNIYNRIKRVVINSCVDWNEI